MTKALFNGLTPAGRKKIEGRLKRGKDLVLKFAAGDKSTRDQIRAEADRNLRGSLRRAGLSETEIQALKDDLPNQARQVEAQLPSLKRRQSTTCTSEKAHERGK